MGIRYGIRYVVRNELSGNENRLMIISMFINYCQMQILIFTGTNGKLKGDCEDITSHAEEEEKLRANK